MHNSLENQKKLNENYKNHNKMHFRPIFETENSVLEKGHTHEDDETQPDYLKQLVLILAQ